MCSGGFALRAGRMGEVASASEARRNLRRIVWPPLAAIVFMASMILANALAAKDAKQRKDRKG
ncbi:MAG: hypothetical protein COZ38_01435 [Rhodocyclales bacterium CG_4_10_14_3_um_filter_68_10]|nr:MAG: hypothetical protein COZ38_01435 [Rhodocyclales bacterium CG_4_10_14_3_um_filter_68_10]